MEDKSFLGIGWSFPPQFNLYTSEVEMVSNEVDIEESLRILLSTQRGERIMHPEYGCDLYKLVFEPQDQTTSMLIKQEIYRAILIYEPRIEINEILVEGKAGRDDLLYITVDYTVHSTNTRHNMVYPMYLTEGTNIRDLI